MHYVGVKQLFSKLNSPKISMLTWVTYRILWKSEMIVDFLSQEMVGDLMTKGLCHKIFIKPRQQRK